MLRFGGSGDIKDAVRDHLASRTDLKGLRVIDIPAGKGDLSAFLRDRGADVEPYDLFPESFEAQGLTCGTADLRARLPIPDERADVVLFQEAIEHLPDPLYALRELNRVLRPGGVLLLTTPNDSHLRAKLSRLLVESELYNRLPPSELDAVWQSSDGQQYFGHLFLIGVQRLRLLAKLSGFRLDQVLPVKVSVGSALLGVLYPLIWLTNRFALWRTNARHPRIDSNIKREVHREIVRLNLNPTILFGKHLFLEFRKEQSWDEVDLAVHKDPRSIR